MQWYRNGTLLNTARDPDLQVSSYGSLHVKNAQKQRDEGSYYCLVSNGKESVISSTASVRFACKYNDIEVKDTAVSRKVVQLKSIKAYATNTERHDGLWLFTVASSSSRVLSAMEGGAMDTCLRVLKETKWILSELLLKFIAYFPDYLSALSRTLLRCFGQPFSKQLFTFGW